MKLQLLIPQYKETEQVLKPLLDSISIQQNIDFKDIGVIICNDGSDVILSDSFLNTYRNLFDISYFKEPHRGVSGTRNACLDYATADYVMFCDADDMFFNVCGLWVIFREISAGFDSLVSVFVEETRTQDKKEVVYINREKDSTFVHGKVYNRQYLLDNNIRWNESLTIHEDSYFNILCQTIGHNIKYCPTPFYLWKWRDESICRHDPKYMVKTYKNLIDSNDALVCEFLKRDLENRANFYVAFMIFDAYYTMNKPEWINQENRDFREETEYRFSLYFNKYKENWKKVSYQDKMKISNGVRSRMVSEGMMMEGITVDNWLKKINKLIKR